MTAVVQPLQGLGLAGRVVLITGAARGLGRAYAETLARQGALLALQDAGLKKEDLLFTGVFIGTGLDLNATNFSFRWGIGKFARRWAEQLELELTDAELNGWVAALRDAAGPALNGKYDVAAIQTSRGCPVGCFTISGAQRSETLSGLESLSA